MPPGKRVLILDFLNLAPWDTSNTVAKILIIDDSKLMRHYLRRCLEKSGYEVEDWMPFSAMEVTEHLIASEPDLLLCDYQMPGCNGLSVVRMAKRSCPTIPILILSAFCDDDMRTTFTRLGVDHVLSKPIKPELLIHTIQNTLSKDN